MMEGKRAVYMTAFVLNIVGFICLFIAFASPYWVVSWPRVYSGFKRTGLWETCFAGLIISRDPTQKAYHGCWWILAPEYQRIRDWIMPWWFIITQIIITCALVAEAIDVIVLIYVYAYMAGESATGRGKKRVPFKLIQTTTFITITSAFFKAATLILFGVAVYVDRMWMPEPHLNYMSWSYGLALLSTFLSFFSSIAHFAYRRIALKEFYEPPNLSQPMIQMSQGQSTLGSTSDYPKGSMSGYQDYPTKGSSSSYQYPPGGSVSGYPAAQGSVSGYPATQGSVSGYPAAQGSVSGYPAAQGSVSGYPAAQGSVSGYPASQGSVSGYPAAQGSVSGYPAAQGSGSGYPAIHHGSGSTREVEF